MSKKIVPTDFNECIEIQLFVEDYNKYSDLDGITVRSLVNRIPNQNAKKKIMQTLLTEYSDKLDIPIEITTTVVPLMYRKIAYETKCIINEMSKGSDVPTPFTFKKSDGNLDSQAAILKYTELKEEFSTIIDGRYDNYFKLGKVFTMVNYLLSHGDTIGRILAQPLCDEIRKMMKFPAYAPNSECDSDGDSDDGYYTASETRFIETNLESCFGKFNVPINAPKDFVKEDSSSWFSSVYKKSFAMFIPYWNNAADGERNKQTNGLREKLLGSWVSFPWSFFGFQDTPITVSVRSKKIIGGVKRPEPPKYFGTIRSLDSVYTYIAEQKKEGEIEFEICVAEPGTDKKTECFKPTWYEWNRTWIKNKIKSSANVVALITLVGGLQYFLIENIEDHNGTEFGTVSKIGYDIAMIALRNVILTIGLIKQAHYQVPYTSKTTQEGVQTGLILAAAGSFTLAFGRYGIVRDVMTTENMSKVAATLWSIIGAGITIKNYGTPFRYNIKTASDLMFAELQGSKNDKAFTQKSLFTTIRKRMTNTLFKQFILTNFALNGLETIFLYQTYGIGNDSASAGLQESLFWNGYDVRQQTGSSDPLTYIIFALLDGLTGSTPARTEAVFTNTNNTLIDISEHLKNTIIENAVEGANIDDIKRLLDYEVRELVNRIPNKELLEDKTKEFSEMFRSKIIESAYL